MELNKKVFLESIYLHSCETYQKIQAEIIKRTKITMATYTKSSKLKHEY